MENLKSSIKKMHFDGLINPVQNNKIKLTSGDLMNRFSSQGRVLKIIEDKNGSTLEIQALSVPVPYSPRRSFDFSLKFGNNCELKDIEIKARIPGNEIGYIVSSINLDPERLNTNSLSLILARIGNSINADLYNNHDTIGSQSKFYQSRVHRCC